MRKTRELRVLACAGPTHRHEEPNVRKFRELQLPSPHQVASNDVLGLQDEPNVRRIRELRRYRPLPDLFLTSTVRKFRELRHAQRNRGADLREL